MNLAAEGSSKTSVRNASTRPQRRPAVRSYSLGEESLLYDPDTDTAHAINAPAMAIWYLCDGSRSIQEISEELGEWVDRDGPDLIDDVHQGLVEFQKLGLILPT